MKYLHKHQKIVYKYILGLETHLEEGWMLQIKEQDEVEIQQQLLQVVCHLLHLLIGGSPGQKEGTKVELRLSLLDP